MESKAAKINLLPDAVLQKMRSWCAYQERSQQETRRKLYDYALSSEETEEIIASLISENFLNEERFAMALTSGKFRIKLWGKNKIKLELKKHRIPDLIINKALKSIDGEEYEKAIIKNIEKKLRLVKAGDQRKRFYTVLNYLVSRGFESDLANEQLNLILKKN